ncbi:HNH endonuclease [Rodentibacter haemolyticus]|uniref:HNH endonuclease n=1 Tax=Rodentibacter haemolyticus TaxID=2778911 RepID=A0ABX6UZ58_9PAST|nr:HNH endonuclease [Rodentibacter haemolyticus]QPB43420.1 HNH endonuclease [Rodentibacter haemolyticus]
MEYKYCKDCGEYLPVDREHFGQYKNKRSDGSIKVAYRNSCRKCMAANTAKYHRENPLAMAARIKRRSQHMEIAGGSYTEQEISILRNKLNDMCRFCGKSLNGGGDIEHLTPISRGGSNNINNLTLSCHKCNKEKTNKTLFEYLEWRQERKLHIRDIEYIEFPDNPLSPRGRRSYK